MEFENIKIWIGGNDILCKKVQSVLIKKGYFWKDEGSIIRTSNYILYAGAIYTFDDGSLGYCDNTPYNKFYYKKKDEHKKIRATKLIKDIAITE